MTTTAFTPMLRSMKRHIAARKRAARHPKAWPVAHIAFLARCIADLEDAGGRAVASADFAAVHMMTAGRFDAGHTQFGRIKFTAPAALT
jgi:hypothetical protein